MFEDSNTLVFVCNVTNGNAAYTALPAGSGGFYHYPNGALNEDAIVAGETVYFVHRNSDGVYSYSPPFTLAQIHNAGSMDNEARQEQVTYLGYNGVSGSMDADNSTYYGLGVVLDHTFGMLNNSPLILTIPYKSSSAATQSEVAAGLAIEATNVLKRQAYKPFKVERINSGAQLVDLNNFALTNGSKFFTSGDDDTATLLVGSIIRVEEPENDGDAVTDPCYIIVGHDSGAGAARVYELDQPFQGVTNADHDHVSTIVEGDWGLKFTGISVTDANFNPVTDEPFVVSFTLMTRDFETATVTQSVRPVIGSGTYQQVAALEAYAQFQKKNRSISAYPPTVRDIEATSGAAYEIHSFEIWTQNSASTTTGIAPISKTRIVLCELSTVTDDFDTNIGATTVTGVIA
jgi:hypothetical protein